MTYTEYLEEHGNDRYNYDEWADCMTMEAFEEAVEEADSLRNAMFWIANDYGTEDEYTAIDALDTEFICCDFESVATYDDVDRAENVMVDILERMHSIIEGYDADIDKKVTNFIEEMRGW